MIVVVYVVRYNTFHMYALTGEICCFYALRSRYDQTLILTIMYLETFSIECHCFIGIFIMHLMSH